jgi:hypothetical protein
VTNPVCLHYLYCFQSIPFHNTPFSHRPSNWSSSSFYRIIFQNLPRVCNFRSVQISTPYDLSLFMERDYPGKVILW